MKKERVLMKAFTIYEPLFGSVPITQWEMSLTSLGLVHRLRYIRQLGAAYLVFSGANHTRFEHTIGTLHLGGKLASKLEGTTKIEKNIALIRIACLMHDVGHGPFSHISEELLMREKGKTHEDRSAEMIRSPPWIEGIKQCCKGIINNEDIITISNLIKGKSLSPYLGQIVSSSIDVDRMDYLLRDAYHTGISYGIMNPYLLILYLVRWNDQLAVTEEGGLSEAESLLIARDLFYAGVNYKPKVRSANTIMQKSIELLVEEEIELDQILQLKDHELIQKLHTLANKNERLCELVNAFDTRNLYEHIPGEGIINWTMLEFLNHKLTEKLEDLALRIQAGSDEEKIENRKKLFDIISTVKNKIENELQERLGCTVLVDFPRPPIPIVELETKVLEDSHSRLRLLKSVSPRLAQGIENSSRQRWSLMMFISDGRQATVENARFVRDAVENVSW